MNKTFWMGGGGSNWAGELSERGKKLSAGRFTAGWEREFKVSNRFNLGDISFDDSIMKVGRGYKNSIRKAVETRWNNNAGYKKNISTKQKEDTINFLQKTYVKKVNYNRGKSSYW